MAGLKGKVVLITGASSGIGKGTAIHFSTLGCKVSIVARNLDHLKAVAQECKASGAEDVFFACHDLSIEAGCTAAVEDTVQHFGGLDVLVNNAGILMKDSLPTLSSETFDVTMNINVKSALRLTQASIPHLEKSTIKSIVNVSSIAGLRAYPGALAYKMSKAAMDQLTRCSALDLAPKQIRVNSVNPGVIEATDLFDKSGMAPVDITAYLEECKRIHPLGRPGRVDEVAKVIAFLASEDASFICGQTLAIDGGRSITCLYGNL